MKTLYGALVFVAVALSSPARADEPPTVLQPPAPLPLSQPYYPPAPPPAYIADPIFTLIDVFFYRPVGLAVTLVGTGLFVGLSPLTALASVPEPHDAFHQTYKLLVAAPAGYTFVRPIGNRAVPYIHPYPRP